MCNYVFCSKNVPSVHTGCVLLCQNGGTVDANCSSCLCPPGYTGGMCEFDVDKCASSPCQNGGTCDDMINGFECLCAGGFTGLLCEVAID